MIAGPSAPSSPIRSALRAYAPLVRGDPDSLLERGATFLPYEREVRDRFQAWDAARHATEFHARVPGDLLAVLREVPTPAGLSRALGRRRLYRSYPLPGRPLEGPWVAFEDPEVRPREGRAYRIPRPERRPLEWKAASEPWGVEEVLWASAPEPLGEGGLFPRPCLSPRQAESELKEFAEATGLSSAQVSSLLLPFVGSPPWHARPPGLNLVVGTWEELPPRLLAGIENPLRRLLPPWDAIRRSSTIGRGTRAAASTWGAPYSVFVGPAGPRTWEHLRDPPISVEASSLLYGGFGADRLGDVLFDAHLPLLSPLESWMSLSTASLDDEAVGTLGDHLVRAHFLEPEPLEGEALHGAVDDALDRIRAALRLMPVLLHVPAEEYSGFLAQAWGMRDHLVQAALAHARILGRPELSVRDVRAVADRFVDSVSAMDTGRSAATRELLTVGGRVRSRREFTRLFLLRSLLMERPDLSEDEVWERLRKKGVWKRKETFLAYLARCSEQGVVVEVKLGTYRWGGL